MTTKPKRPAPPAAKTLAEQKTDFTAEGSPPPGVTGMPVPAPIRIGHDGKQAAPNSVPRSSNVSVETSGTAKK